MHHYPSYQQTTEYTCGPAAALTLLYWHGNKDYDELSLSKEMKTRPYPYGTNVKDMVSFFEKIGWTVESSLKADKISRYEAFRDFDPEDPPVDSSVPSPWIMSSLPGGT